MSGRVDEVGASLVQFLQQVISDQSSAEQVKIAREIAASLPEAILNHPDFASATAQQQFHLEVETEAYAAYLPQIYGNSSAGYQRIDGVTDKDPKLGLGVKQQLYDFGMTAARVDASQQRALASGVKRDLKRNELLFRAVQAWHQLYKATRIEALHLLNVASRREIADFVQERANLGGSAPSDVLRARARQAEAEAGVAAASRQVAIAEAVWMEVTGLPLPGRLAITAPLSSVDRLLSDDEISMRARQFAAVEALFTESKATRFDAEAAEAALWPQFILDLSLAKRVGGDSSLPVDRSAMVRLEYDFYTGGAETARANQARAQALEKKAEAEAELRRTERQLRQARAEVVAGEQTKRARVHSVTVATESLQAVREQFAFRRGSLLDLLRAQEDLFNAGRDLVDAETNQSLYQYQLLYLMSDLEQHFTSLSPR